MEDALTGRDALDLAIKAEEKGLKLYRTLASNSKNFHVSQMFKALARDEEKHMEELKNWSDKLTEHKPQEAYPGEYIMYIRAMAEESTFKCDNACARFLEADLNENDAVQAGITFEKDFIIFLHNLRKHVKDEDQHVVDKVIKSEEKHLKDLYALKGKIKK